MGGEGGLPRQSGKKPFTAGCVNRMEDRKGETYLEAKRKALPLQKKKKRWRFSFAFYNKKGAEILKLRA